MQLPSTGKLRFLLRELSGSLGDLGTFLPISMGLAVACDMHLGTIFLLAGAAQVIVGLRFDQPIAVQPMKAIAAVAIAEHLSPGAVTAAGILTAGAVLLAGVTGAVDWLARTIPLSVVRGLQAGVGVKLAWTGLGWIGALPAWGWNSWIAAACLGLLFGLAGSRIHLAVATVFCAGFAVAAAGAGPAPAAHAAVALPPLDIHLPTAHQWWIGFSHGAIVQLPLTLLNSVIAVCALSADYFPRRGIAPRAMATSVGALNLLTVPWGGMPVCHGSGGLAAHYRFGARTGWSMVLLGALKMGAGLLTGGVLWTWLQAYPRAVLGTMVVFSGITLAAAAKDCLRRTHWLPMAASAAVIVAYNTLVGFLVGCAAAACLAAVGRLRRKP